jgi:acetyl-CoA synthetase
MSDVVWRPDEATIEHANATRLIRRAGVGGYAELVRRSAEDPGWFWPLVVEDLGLEFSQPWTRVFDDSRGPEWTTWFVGAKLSIANNCAHRWGRATPDRVAAVGLAEDGTRRELTYAELSRDVTRLAE